MIRRFVDTSGWAAWLDAGDSLHAQAAELLEEMWCGGGKLFTTNWVLVELTALPTRPIRLDKQRQIQFYRELHNDPVVSVVSVDATLEDASWKLWMARHDKNWSATDCASFAVMDRYALTDAITADRHFEQAGFARLPTP